MDVEYTLGAVDVNMPEAAPPRRQGFKDQALLPLGQPRMSKFTTGILTASGWVPRNCSSWYVLRTGAVAEVDALFECHNEERTERLPTAIPFDRIGDALSPDEHSDEEANDMPGKFLDYNSYFRYAGWTGCASLENDNSSPAQALAVNSPSPQAATPAATAVAPLQANCASTSIAPDHLHIPSAISGRTREANIAHNDKKITTQLLPRTKQTKHSFHAEEDAWLLLLHSKIKAAAKAGRTIKLPGPAAIATAFNAFFEGRVLKDRHGCDLPPREARGEKSIKGKMTKTDTKIWHLRDITRRLLEGNRGGVAYVPEITEDELERYRQDGTVLA